MFKQYGSYETSDGVWIRLHQGTKSASAILLFLTGNHPKVTIRGRTVYEVAKEALSYLRGKFGQDTVIVNSSAGSLPFPSEEEEAPSEYLLKKIRQEILKSE